jgi:hypothetical protein
MVFTTHCAYSAFGKQTAKLGMLTTKHIFMCEQKFSSAFETNQADRIPREQNHLEDRA